jgi:hypothetical protein
VAGVKVEADRQVVGEEVVAAAETDRKYIVSIQSQRKRASHLMTDSHNPIDDFVYLRKGNGIL